MPPAPTKPNTTDERIAFSKAKSEVVIKPGVAVLFGENKNYIIYYQINKKTVQSTSFEEISIEEDLLSQITKFFLSKYNLQEVSLVEGLVKCY